MLIFNLIGTIYRIEITYDVFFGIEIYENTSRCDHLFQWEIIHSHWFPYRSLRSILCSIFERKDYWVHPDHDF